MTTIEVPGTAPAPPGSQGVKLGVAGFSILLGAVLAWAATASGDPSLWFVFAVFILVVAAFIGWLACNHVGRAGRVRLTWCAHRAWSRGCWAALESRGGQLLMLTTSIVMMLIPAGVIISLPEAGIVMPLLIGVIGLMGTVDGILSLRNPVGWFFDQYIIAIVGPGKRLAAFSWAEVEKVELGRGVEVTGRGRTVTIPNGNTASDPAVVARVIEFYRTNPRSRPELSDDRFLDRLRTGQL